MYVLKHMNISLSNAMFAEYIYNRNTRVKSQIIHKVKTKEKTRF